MKRGEIYEIRSRNLIAGVFDGERGFIGIREKFDSEYLFTEYLNATVTSVGRQLGVVPDGIELVTSLPSLCQGCGRPARWTGPPAPAPWACDGNCDETLPYAPANVELFNLLKRIESELD